MLGEVAHDIDDHAVAGARDRMFDAVEHVLEAQGKGDDPAMAHRRRDGTLDRLARRLAIPSRQISAAINRTYGRNISQVVNEYRIRDAMRLLRALGKGP